MFFKIGANLTLYCKKVTSHANVKQCLEFAEYVSGNVQGDNTYKLLACTVAYIAKETFLN